MRKFIVVELNSGSEWYDFLSGKASVSGQLVVIHADGIVRDSVSTSVMFHKDNQIIAAITLGPGQMVYEADINAVEP